MDVDEPLKVIREWVVPTPGVNEVRDVHLPRVGFAQGCDAALHPNRSCTAAASSPKRIVGLTFRFHQAIISLSTSQFLATMPETLFSHMRSIRAWTSGENDRAPRSIIDHMTIIKA